MTLNGLLFFAVFAVVIFVMYLALRREWASAKQVGIIGVSASAMTMVLVMLAEPGVSVVRGVVLGIPTGAGIGIATLVIGLYFARAETAS